MNRSWIVAGLFVVAIVLSGCDGDYFEPHPVMQAGCQNQAGRINADGEVEWDDPVPCPEPDDTSKSASHSFPVTEEVQILMRAVEEGQNLRDAGLWAHCDPASTYPNKDPNKCRAPQIEIGVDGE